MIPAPLQPSFKRRIVLLTGMSGAGLSTALKEFEDLGYEAVDNLRLGLVPALIKDGEETDKPLAVVIDTRNTAFSVDTMLEMVKQLSEHPLLATRLVFLECSDDALQRRFTETRRRHPLAQDRPVMDGIRAERELIWRLRDAADHVIDTSLITIHELRRQIAGHFKIDTSSGLTLFITSFSYRHGVPREADMVFDARFLVNPHWDANLRNLTGQDEEVAAYIRRDGDYANYMKHLHDLLAPLLPRYEMEGKSYFTIAVGCTGGRHRSVFIAEEMANMLASEGFVVGIGHRDLDRGAGKA